MVRSFRLSTCASGLVCPPGQVDDETRTIVVNIHDKTVGCIVDAVTQVMRINRDQIQPPPLSVLAIAHQYIAGLARLEDRLLIILDIERLFDEQSSVVSGQWQEKGSEPSGDSTRKDNTLPAPCRSTEDRFTDSLTPVKNPCLTNRQDTGAIDDSGNDQLQTTIGTRSTTFQQAQPLATDRRSYHGRE